MASERLIKSKIRPVMQRHPNLTLFDRKLFFQPIGWYLRGCIFSRTRIADSAFLYRFVLPLFEPGNIYGMIGWGDRLRTHAGNQIWYLNEDDFLPEFEWAFEHEIAAHVENIATGEDFKAYIEKDLVKQSWRDYAMGIGFLHMGEVGEATRIFREIRQKFKDDEGLRRAFAVANSCELLETIENHPETLEEKLIATAMKTAESFKITPFWERPKSFWDKPPRFD